MPRKPRIAHPLRFVRAALKKSQPQFAKMFGVSASYIQAIELGQRSISNELADAIMLRLGVDAESLKRERGVPKSLIGLGKAEVGLGSFRSDSADARAEMDKLLATYAALEKMTDRVERFRLSVRLWEKEITPRWEWHIPYRALNDKLEILFEAAEREKKHFTVAMQLSRWIENILNEFQLGTTINAIRSTRKADEAHWPTFMETLLENFRLLPAQKERQIPRRRKKR